MFMTTRKWIRRPYEKAALCALRAVRTLVLLWARQCRKSTTLGAMAFDEMSRAPGRRVIAASASLLVGSELVSKSVTAIEQAAIVAREAAAMQKALLASLAQSQKPLNLVAANSQTGAEYRSLTSDDFTALYRAGRLEIRLYHTRTTFSRLQIIAPNPATARGWTGTVLRDEAAFTPAALESQLQEAVGPIIDADPSFRLVYASNLPADDRHPFFEMTLPPPGLEFNLNPDASPEPRVHAPALELTPNPGGRFHPPHPSHSPHSSHLESPPNPDGHFYRGQNNLLIHRVALPDACAAGHTLYDPNTARPLTLEQFYAQAINKGALRRNYLLIHEFGGAAAIDFLALDAAQRRGLGQSALISADTDADFHSALAFLRQHLHDGPVGIGFDVATTTRATSNPSSLTVTEQRGADRVQVLVLLWKERQPQIARDRLRRVLETIAARPRGGRARRLCIDASSERYFAQETSDLLRHLVPVELVIHSAAIHPPGYAQPVNMKTCLGDLYSAHFNDNHYTAPPGSYFKTDHRLVIKDRGAYLCDPFPDGMHGDTFDSAKLAHWPLPPAPASLLDPAPLRTGPNHSPRHPPFYPPRL